MSNKAKAAQQKVIEEKLEEMIEWYAVESGGKTPDLHVDEKTYRGKILRWLEPALPGVDNPVLIEECIGDSWTLRFERREVKIQVFT